MIKKGEITPKRRKNIEVPDLVEEMNDQIGVIRDKEEGEKFDNNIQ